METKQPNLAKEDLEQNVEPTAAGDKLLTHRGFPVIGLGASAGGLQPLKDFFGAMPSDCGMAFVVIMHLSANHESHAAEILQTTTKMPIFQVVESIEVEPNSIYVIPPSKHLAMNDKHISLIEPRPMQFGQQVSIDLFFRTLGDTHKDKSVGIVLSGMGADGANGLKRIKEQNGLTFAQDPREAEHDSMPRHAVDTGLIDFVLPVAEMPGKLIEIWRNASRIELPSPTEPSAISQENTDEAALREILTILRANTGHDFGYYKRATVLRRIERRLQINQLQNIWAYLELVRASAEEAESLLKDLLISVTNFFRDHTAFEEFERAVVPLLFQDKSSADTLRVWVAGCATGEEAYSLAMLLQEFADKHETQPQIQIFATDLDEAAINTARNGFYTEAIEADVSPERLRRFFTEENGGYRIKKAVRETVLFAVHDLLKDPPFSRLDAVTCRNLLIYLNRDAQKHLFGLFHLVLRPNGFMFLGNSESADAAADLFQTVDKKHRIYRHQAAPPPRAQLLPNVPLDLLPPRAFSVRIGRSSESQKISFSELHRQILEQSAPASVLVNQNYDIIHLTGRTADFLEFAPGEPSYNLLKVVQPELRIELRTALFQAQQTRESVEARRVHIKRDGQEFFVNTLVRPSVDRNSPNRTQNGQIYFAVLFTRIESLTTVHEAGVPQTDEAEPVLRLLEAELHRTREAYQMTIEQFETQTEELKASNEELQTINEELRSASEELEIGKEELHSVNEETQTVNYELKSKIDELAHSNGDLRNLIASTDMATIFVDSALNIKFYTPRAQNIFSLINSDIGRSLLDITHNLEYTDLRRDAEQVLNDFQNLEREVSSRDERWYIARIIPYRPAENRIDGVILTFVDFTTRKQAENDLLIANQDLAQRTRVLTETNARLQTEIGVRADDDQERGQLLRRIVFAQEDERRRIAREMHDQLGQQLTVLKLKLDALKADCGENSKLCDQIEALQTIAQQLDADVGYLAWEMRPSALDDLGLETALASYVKSWSSHFAIPVQLHSNGLSGERLSPELETTLYRIAQEALNNIAKHAGAANVAVMLERRGDQVQLTVEDDGAGFDAQHILEENAQQGFGLIGMRERAALVGGTIELESEPGVGATIVARIPAAFAAEETKNNQKTDE